MHRSISGTPSLRGPRPEDLRALFADEEIDCLREALARGWAGWEEDAFNTAFAGVSVWAQRTRVNEGLLEAS